MNSPSFWAPVGYSYGKARYGQAGALTHIMQNIQHGTQFALCGVKPSAASDCAVEDAKWCPRCSRLLDQHRARGYLVASVSRRKK